MSSQRRSIAKFDITPLTPEQIQIALKTHQILSKSSQTDLVALHEADLYEGLCPERLAQECIAHRLNTIYEDDTYADGYDLPEMWSWPFDVIEMQHGIRVAEDHINDFDCSYSFASILSQYMELSTPIMFDLLKPYPHPYCLSISILGPRSEITHSNSIQVRQATELRERSTHSVIIVNFIDTAPNGLAQARTAVVKIPERRFNSASGQTNLNWVEAAKELAKTWREEGIVSAPDDEKCFDVSVRFKDGHTITLNHVEFVYNQQIQILERLFSPYNSFKWEQKLVSQDIPF